MNTTHTESDQSPHRRSGRKAWLGAVVVLVLAAGGWYYWRSGGEEEAADQPLIATVEIGDIENTITAAGSLQPYEFVDVGAR